MADLLGTGISGLLASRVALDTTGQNIANASTPGYSRQRVQLATRDPQAVGTWFVGQGVDVVGVQRAYSQYLTTALWSQDSSLQRATTFSQLTDNLNNLLAGSNNLQAALDDFYSSVQDAANSPGSAPTRQAMLGKATSLVSTFHTLDQQLGQQSTQLNQRISDTVASINGLAQNIASLNQQIESQTAGGSPPNDLLDRRDQLIQQLSEQVGITTSPQGNSVNIIAGNGQTLVNGSSALALKAVPDPYDPTRINVVASTGATLDGQLQGGTLGGLLDYRGSVLEPAQNQLGRAAIAFASALNAQHRQGMDLNGQLGGDLFALPAPQALPAGGNAGNATMTASIADVGALQSSDYTLRFDGSAWSVSTTGGNPVTATGSGTAADPLSFDGLQLVVAGSAAAGDRFKVEPTRAA
ncbi:MAG: flagellar hook-associated protein FlgK, partial [Rhodanobacteraceae bacterium]